MRRTTKTLLALGMAFSLAVSGFAGVAEAKKPAADATTETKTDTKTGKVQQLKAKVTCTAAGKVNLSFSQTIEWSPEAAATLTDADNKTFDVKISKKGTRTAVIRGEGMVKGQRYTATINGIRIKGTEEYTSASGVFTAKNLKGKLKAKKITKKVAVKAKSTIIVKCKGTVQLKDAVVTVKDGNNKEYTAKVVGKSKGNIKVRINGLKKGMKYTVTITGVKTKKELYYASVSTTFVAKK